VTFFRIAIIVVAVLELWYFSKTFELAFGTFADPDPSWFNVLSALAEGVIAPLLALAAIGLAIANCRLGLAAIFLGAAALVSAMPVVAFAIGIMIYGF
jgi:hypothetical protein